MDGKIDQWIKWVKENMDRRENRKMARWMGHWMIR